MYQSNPRYAIALHAGAGESYQSNSDEYAVIRAFLESLVLGAKTQLHHGATAIEVVTDVTAALEDFPHFNAGRGAALNILGEHELEAAVVDGSSGEYRAALNVKHTKNPVRLAHILLGDPDVAIISGQPADEYAGRHGLHLVDNSYFTVPKRYQYWSANRKRCLSQNIERHGTVEAVALDLHGNLAAATSTGGTMFKRVGRVGDTAINGAGIYADKALAIVCSGSGEAILKSLVAKSVAEGTRRGLSVDNAAKSALLASASQSITSSCGVIAVDCHGAVSVQSNARTFAIASTGWNSSLVVGIVGSSLIHLDQLLFYKDELMKIGFAKYPTMNGQAILELEAAQGFHVLDAHAFGRVWQVVQLCALNMKTVWNAAICSCLASGRLMHFFPHSTTSVLQTTGHLSSEADIWRGVQDTAKVIADQNAHPTQCVEIEFHLISASNHRASVQATDERSMMSSSLTPASFHERYPGYMTLEPGLRAANLTDLPGKALLMTEFLATKVV